MMRQQRPLRTIVKSQMMIDARELTSKTSRFFSWISKMPVRLPYLRSGRLLPLRSQQSVAARNPPPLCVRLAQRRQITADEKPLPKAEGKGQGPNQSQLPHVSEEAAATAEITGGTGPDIEEQGTPVEEVRGCLHQDHDYDCHTNSITTGSEPRQHSRREKARSIERKARIKDTKWDQIIFHNGSSESRHCHNLVGRLGSRVPRPYFWITGITNTCECPPQASIRTYCAASHRLDHEEREAGGSSEGMLVSSTFLPYLSADWLV